MTPVKIGFQENKQTLVFKNIWTAGHTWRKKVDYSTWKSWLKLSCFLWFQIIFNNNHLKSVRHLGNHIWCGIRIRYWKTFRTIHITVSIFLKYITVKRYYVVSLYNASMITLGKTHLKLAIRKNPWFRDKIKFLHSLVQHLKKWM